MAKRMFQAFDEINVADGKNNTKNLQVSGSLVEAKTAKGGGHVVMGVPVDVLHLLIHNPDTICILIVLNRQEYEKVIDLPLSEEATKEKSAKWDALEEKISKYYAEPEDEDYDKDMDESGLIGIGETVARAFGFL